MSFSKHIPMATIIAFLFINGVQSKLSNYPYDPPYYNIIDPTPKCYTMDLCTEYGEWGSSIDSIHPSSEERTLHILRNMARLFPKEYKESKYGVRLWGYKGDSWDWNDKKHCGKGTDYPTYWYSMGTQQSRFHAWDKFTCKKSIGHETCSDPDRCERFPSCSFGHRAKAFIPIGGIWAKAEGIYGMNSAFDGGHCSAIFDPDYKYFGIGYWPTMSSATTLYIKNGPPRDYPIYMASHLDETSRIPKDHYNENNQHLTFLMGWYGDADTINKKADNVYILYDGTMTEMDKLFGDSSSGIYEAHFNYPDSCEPYAFLVVTEDDVIYRLPEEEKYFYGTSWVELEKGVPNKPGIDYPACNENHYYLDDRENNIWIANGGENITKSDIKYIDHQKCQGCNKVNSLVQVYHNFVVSGTIFSYNAQKTVQRKTVLTPTSDPTTSPTLRDNIDLLGFCETSGDRGYEVNKSFKMKIKSDKDKQKKEDKTKDFMDQIIRDNPDCDDYDVSVEEEWVRTKKVDVDITVCFHCIEYDAKHEGKSMLDEQSDAGFRGILNVDTNNEWLKVSRWSAIQWLSFILVCILFLWIICFYIGAYVKCRNDRKVEKYIDELPSISMASTVDI